MAVITLPTGYYQQHDADSVSYTHLVRVLLVGASFSADLHADAYSRCTDIAEIVAICDKATDRISALADRYGFTGYQAYDDFEKAIDEVDCDVVDVCMPNFLHKAVALKAFEKGRHVISEKPLATTCLLYTSRCV